MYLPFKPVPVLTPSPIGIIDGGPWPHDEWAPKPKMNGKMNDFRQRGPERVGTRSADIVTNTLTTGTEAGRMREEEIREGQGIKERHGRHEEQRIHERQGRHEGQGIHERQRRHKGQGIYERQGREDWHEGQRRQQQTRHRPVFSSSV